MICIRRRVFNEHYARVGITQPRSLYFFLIHLPYLIATCRFLSTSSSVRAPYISGRASIPSCAPSLSICECLDRRGFGGFSDVDIRYAWRGRLVRRLRYGGSTSPYEVSYLAHIFSADFALSTFICSGMNTAARTTRLIYNTPRPQLCKELAVAMVCTTELTGTVDYFENV